MQYYLVVKKPWFSDINCNMDESYIMPSEKKKNPDSKDCIIYVMFWGRQNCRDRKQITRSEGPKEILGFGQVKKQSLIVMFT